MNDAQLLEALARTNTLSPDADLPAGAWSPAEAFDEVEWLLDGGHPTWQPAPTPRRHIGWLVAASAFVVVLLVGALWLVEWGSSDPTGPVSPATRPPVTDSPVTQPPATLPPTTLASATAEPEAAVPAEAQALVDVFFASLSAGDIAAAEALFVPGGEYMSSDFFDTASSAIGSEDTVVGEPELFAFWTWQWDMMGTTWSAEACTGDGVDVVCRTEVRGLITAHLPGGRATGRVVFTLGSDGIVLVEDEVVLGATDFDIRGFWRTAIPEIAPEIEELWPGGNGPPPFTTEFARVVIERYPQWLADQGIPVAAEYLDGSLLEALDE